MKLNYVRKFLRLQYQCPDTRMISMRLTFVSAVILVPPPPHLFSRFLKCWSRKVVDLKDRRLALRKRTASCCAVGRSNRSIAPPSPHSRPTWPTARLCPRPNCTPFDRNPFEFFPVLAFFTAFFFTFPRLSAHPFLKVNRFERLFRFYPQWRILLYIFKYFLNVVSDIFPLSRCFLFPVVAKMPT